MKLGTKANTFALYRVRVFLKVTSKPLELLEMFLY